MGFFSFYCKIYEEATYSFVYAALFHIALTQFFKGRRGRDRMVVGFPTACAISVYHH